MSEQCKHCHRCKNGCTDICKCCGKCNTCGQLAAPVAAPPAPVYVPYPIYPQPAIQPWPGDQWGPIIIGTPFKPSVTCGDGAAIPTVGFCQTVELSADAQTHNWLVGHGVNTHSTSSH